MSYTDKKITQAEINAHHVQGATDYLIGNAQQNKAVFDDLPEFIAGKFNDLIDEIAGQHGDEIRAAVDEWLAEHPEVTTTVQDNSLTTAKYVDGSVTPAKLDRAYATPSDLNVLDARMDEFTSLPEGSTSGDAELLDIRVGADGETYQSAGGAVRGQVADLKSEINQIDDSIMGDSLVISSANSLSSWESGDIDSSTGADSSWSKATRMKIANAIYAKNDMVLKSTGTGAYIYVYQYNDSACTDFEKQFAKYLNYQGTTELELPKGYYYRLKSYFTDLRVITSSDMETLMGMFVLTKKTQIQKNEELVSEAYKLTSAFNYDDVFTDVDGLSWTSDKYAADYGAPSILNANDYAYTSISVKAGERYSVKGWSFFGQKVALYFIGTTLNTAYPTTSDNPAKYHEFIIDIPTDGTLYINKNYAHTTSEMTIAKVTDTSVAEVKRTYLPSNIGGKVWNVIGDSLSDEDADSDTVYWTYIAEDNGMTATQLAHSGCGFLQGSDPFSTQAQSVSADAEIVTAFGSWNDLNMALGMMSAFNNLGALGDDGDEGLTYTYTDGSGVSQTATNAPSLYGAVRKTIDTILAHSPYAKIGFILPTPWGTRCWFNATNWVRTVMDAYIKAIVDTCAIYSIPVLDLYHNGQMKPWNATFQAKYYKTNDTTHPNSLGHKEFIAPAVEAWMENIVC